MMNKGTNRMARRLNRVTELSQALVHWLAPVDERESRVMLQRWRQLMALQSTWTPPTPTASMRRRRCPAPKALAVTVWPSESSRTVEGANQVLRPSARETKPAAGMAVSRSVRDMLDREEIITRFRRLLISG